MARYRPPIKVPEAEFRALAARRLEAAELAEHFGVGRACIYDKARRWGVKLHRPLRQCAVSREQLQALMDEGLIASEIAERVGRTHQTVVRTARKYGLSIRVGQAGTPPKIDKPTLRKLVMAGGAVADIADHFGVNSNSIYGALIRFDLPTPKEVREAKGMARPDRRRVPGERLLAVPEATAKPEPDWLAKVSTVAAPPTEFWTTERDAQVVASLGLYERIRQLADLWGVTVSKVQARAHRLCVRPPTRTRASAPIAAE